MKKEQSKIRQIKIFLISLIAFSGTAVGTVFIFNFTTPLKQYSGIAKPKQSRERIQAVLKEADEKASKAIEKRIADFTSYIRSRKDGAKPFSEDIVSLYGKWKAITSLVDKEGHKKYVVEKFEQHIFSNNDLASQVKLAVEGSVKDIEGIENELAVTLRQEILEPSPTKKILVNSEDFNRKTTESVEGISQWDAAKSVGNLVVSEVVSQVSTQVLIRLGVSAGVLTVGASNSWWSLGGTIVISLMVDQVWGWFDNPAGEIEKTMIVSLDDLSVKASTAIREELTNVLSERRKIWKKAFEEITL